MPTPSTRTPVRIARGSYSNLNGSVSDLQDGEISYAEDQDKLYIKEGASLVALTYTPASPAFTGTITGVNLTLSGNLTVNGTQTIINTQTLDVEDKQIEIGKVSSPSDTTADQGGWKLKGATDKTFLWVNATDAWTSSEHIHLGNNKELKLGADQDLKLLHIDGSGNWIKSFTSNTLYIEANGDTQIVTNNTDVCAKFIKNGSVELYEDNVKKFQTTTTGVTVTGTVSDSKGNLRSIPQNSQGSAYTLVAADAGKHVMISSGGVTIPNSIFSVGDAITIISNSGSDQTITQASGLTLYNTGDASTGNRTLASRGMCTLIFTHTSYAYISGAGLS